MQIGTKTYYTSLEPQRPSLPIASSSYIYPIGVERYTPRLVAYRLTRYVKKGSKYSVIEVGTS